ncbi:hypothetical protein HPB47_001845 [Ixodes persulcatus]|uniref:Uncharacterized protein n=1 Tax=Ixodes persulcatus TaxID=34615 RepID=A0AC60PP21_IXOPE|nr:hypothetical protein HPB47_001845 [Ixodes persulcatus]
MCRILRSETWKQVERYRDCLRIRCHAGGVGETSAERAYRTHLRTAAQYTEFFWEQARPLLVKRNRTERPVAPSGGQAEVTLLGDARLPPNIKSALDHGPKFCHEPGLRPRTSGISPRGFKFGHIVDHILTHKLKLLTADKEGGFVVAPRALYCTRTRQAIDRNFMLVNPGALTKHAASTTGFPAHFNPSDDQFNPGVTQFNPSAIQFNPSAIQFNPGVSEFNPQYMYALIVISGRVFAYTFGNLERLFI